MPLTENFSFVMNIASLAMERYVLAPGHVLRRATPDEVASIKVKLESFHASAVMIPFLWEARLPLQGTLESLPESEWRYYVIAFEGPNDFVNDFQVASDLATIEIEIGFTVLSKGYGIIFQPSRLFHVLENARATSGFALHISEPDLQDILSVYSQLQSKDEQLIPFKGLARQLGHLKGFPHRVALRFLGYFAILESLLTHPPEPKDPYDSITRQVKTKIALLNNRWPRRIDYGPFGGADADTIWERMYHYRSLLAHGGTPHFTGKLALLRNHETALALLKMTVKSVIRQALSEPRLLVDLRNC